MHRECYIIVAGLALVIAGTPTVVAAGLSKWHSHRIKTLNTQYLKFAFDM